MNPGLPRWAHLGKPYHRHNRVQFSLTPTVQFRMSLDKHSILTSSLIWIILGKIKRRTPPHRSP